MKQEETTSSRKRESPFRRKEHRKKKKKKTRSIQHKPDGKQNSLLKKRLKKSHSNKNLKTPGACPIGFIELIFIRRGPDPKQSLYRDQPVPHGASGFDFNHVPNGLEHWSSSMNFHYFKVGTLTCFKYSYSRYLDPPGTYIAVSPSSPSEKVQLEPRGLDWPGSVNFHCSTLKSFRIR